MTIVVNAYELVNDRGSLSWRNKYNGGVGNKSKDEMLPARWLSIITTAQKKWWECSQAAIVNLQPDFLHMQKCRKVKIAHKLRFSC